jgi:5-methylcytosine-specific restriction enzyme A
LTKALTGQHNDAMAWAGRDQRHSRAWQETRQRVLARDGYRCQIKLTGCHGRATTVDHIRSLAEGGSMTDESNLRAACGYCNGVEGGRVGARRARVASGKASRHW